MPRKNQNTYVHGDWNAICDVCGWKYKASDLRRRWDNLMVCEEDWEEDHPQKHVKAVKDNQSVPWARPEGTDVFIDINDGQCSILERQGVAGQGIAGCMIAGLDSDLASEEDIPSGTFTSNNSTL